MSKSIIVRYIGIVSYRNRLPLDISESYRIEVDYCSIYRNRIVSKSIIVRYIGVVSYRSRLAFDISVSYRIELDFRSIFTSTPTPYDYSLCASRSKLQLFQISHERTDLPGTHGEIARVRHQGKPSMVRRDLSPRD